MTISGLLQIENTSFVYNLSAFYLLSIISIFILGCVATAIGAANNCYPCVCDAVEWTCGCDVC